MKASYTRFILMIVTSTVVMFGLMYLNTYAMDHVYFSETRAWMALYMGGVMAVIMLAFMWGMYASKATNAVILLVSAVAFASGVYFVRSQATIGDMAWMEAMIPHHSIAILTSSRAHFTDPRVQALATRIVDAQKLEIAEMQALIADLNGGPSATPEVDGK